MVAYVESMGQTRQNRVVGRHNGGSGGGGGARSWVFHMVSRITRSWRFAFGALTAVTIWWMLYLIPTASYWYDPQSVVIGETEVGDPIVMFVEQEMHRPVSTVWRVTMRRRDVDGWHTVCNVRGTRDIHRDMDLPDPITLQWWTDGKCHADRAGSYFMTTQWTFRSPMFPGERRTRPLVSNVFDVKERSE